MHPAFIFALLATTAMSADWPQWRGLTRTGISEEKILSQWPGDGPKKLWAASVGTGFSGVVVSGKYVITLGNSDDTDTVTALDAASGKVLWTYSYDAELDPKYFEGGPTSTPTIDGDAVYVLGRQGQLHRLNLADGKVVWTKNIAEETEARQPDWGFTGAPIPVGDLLLLNVGSKGTVVEKATGKLVWKSAPEPTAGYSTPLPLADGTYTFSNTDAYFGLDPKTGNVRWQYPWPTRYGVNAADPVIISPTQLLIASGYNKGSTLIDISKGSEPKSIWQNRNLRAQMNPPVLIDNLIFGIDGDENSKPALRCVDSAKGKVLWSESSIGAGTLIAAEGGKQLIVLSDNGELHLLTPSAESFDSQASAQVFSGKCWTAPTLANGNLYLRNAAGDLAAFDLKPQ